MAQNCGTCAFWARPEGMITPMDYEYPCRAPNPRGTSCADSIRIHLVRLPTQQEDGTACPVWLAKTWREAK